MHQKVYMQKVIRLNGFLILTIVMPLVLTQCAKTGSIVCDGPAPAYSSDVQSIIQSSCAIAGCHGSGSGNGDYTTYNGLAPELSNGRFEREVLINRTMPQGSRLSTSQLQTLQCWFDDGFPNN